MEKHFMRKDSLLRRSMAGLLVVVMLIGLMPAMSVAADAEPAEFIYTLHKLQYNQWGASGYGPDAVPRYSMTTAGHSQEIKTYSAAVTGPFDTAETTPFYHYAKSSGATCGWGDKAYGWVLIGIGSWISTAILVPNSGTYQLSYNAGQYSGSGSIKVYFAPMDAENHRAEEYYVGTINAKADLSNWNAMFDLGEVTAEAGEYVVTSEIVATGNLYGGSFKLTSTDALRTMTLDVENGNALAVDRRDPVAYEINAAIDGNTVSAADADYAVADVADPSIVRASVSEGKLNLYGLTAGSTYIDLRVAVDGVMGWVEIPVTVTDTVDLSGYVLDPGLSDFEVSVGGSMQSEVTLSFGSEEISLAEVSEYSVVSDCPEVLDTVLELVDGALQLTVLGISEGSANLTLSVTADGENHSVTVPITAASKAHTYNFMRLHWGELSTDGYSPSYLSAWDTLDSLSNYHNYDSERFKFHAQSYSGTWLWSAASAKYGPVFTGRSGDFASYQIRLSETGAFTPTLTYYAHPNGGKFDVYLAPTDADVWKQDAYRIGTVDTYASEAAPGQNAVLDSVALKNGDYILAFDFIETGSRTTYISAFDLQTIEAPWIASPAVIPKTITEDSAVQVQLYSQFGGLDIPFADAKVEVENPSVVSASLTENSSSESVTLKLNSLSIGETTVTVTMQYCGVEGKLIIPISVVEQELLPKNYRYDWKKLYYGPWSTSAYAPSDIVSFDMTTAGSAMEINPDTPSDPWMYGGAGGTYSSEGWITSSPTYGIYLYGDQGAWTSYKVRVDQSGVYSPCIGYMSWSWGGPVNLYFAPADAADPRSERYLIGCISTKSSANTYPLYYTAENQYLEAGDYVLSFVIAGTQNGVFSHELLLNAVENDYLHVYADPIADLVQGSIVSVPLHAIYNGNTIDFTEVDSVTVESDDTTCATASIAVDEGNATLSVEAVASGSCHVIITAEKDGISSVVKVPIIAAGVSSRSISLKKNRLIPGERTTVDAAITLTNGSVLSINELRAIEGCSVTIISTSTNIATVTDDTIITAVAPGTALIRMTFVFDGQTYYSGASVRVEDAAFSEVQLSAESETMCPGDTMQLVATAMTDGGNSIGSENVQFTYQSSGDGLVVNETGLLAAHEIGEYSVKVSATFQGVTKTSEINITVADDHYQKLEVDVPVTRMKLGGNGMQLTAKVTTGSGDVFGNEVVTFASDHDCISVSSDGYLTANALGDATITVSVGALSEQVTINVTEGKAGSSYYTEEKLANLRYNVENYLWAKNYPASAAAGADPYLTMLDKLYGYITTQELPRAAAVGVRWDPNMYTCRYCGIDLREKYSNYPWVLDPIDKPFKLQCPDCKRYFPTNDFESFYKSGIDENGNWSYELSLENGQEFLVNNLYPEKGEGWGVDDGYGYRTGKTINLEISSGLAATHGTTHEEIHTYMAYYNHWGLWYDLLMNSVSRLSNAYLYTGDEKYGRIGAILVSRIADVYPDMEIEPYFPWYFNSDGTTPRGKMLGKIWQHGVSRAFTLAYDAFYNLYDDPEVISYLSEKAALYNQENPKTTGNLIRDHIEENLLRENARSIKNGNINGNFGMHQSLMAYTAVVLDSPTESKEMIDWIFNSSSGTTTYNVTGGNFTSQILTNVSRDGTGNEAAPNYNNLWIGSITSIIDALGGYEGYEGSDLFENPKIIKMYKMHFPLTLTRKSTVAIGDSGATADETFHLPGVSALSTAFLNSGDVEIAQMVYFLNGNSTQNLHGSIYENAAELRSKIQAVIDEHGEYPFDESMQVSGFGFDILRSGTLTDTADTQQDFWLYYGRTGGHGHPAALNLGMDAYGLNIAPDFGYPEAADGGYKNIYWGMASVNHNLVMVNDQRQSQINPNGNPIHFDDAGRVKLTDVRAPAAYSETQEYRRAIVSVEVNEEISYGIDFFLVHGGNEHVYSFHALSDTIAESSENLQFVEQGSGTYAGADVAFGSGSLTNGYNFLYDVRRAANPGSEFSVNFKITDFRGTLTDDRDLYLRMTMLNDFELSEVALAKGQPPQRDGNPTELEFVLARRSGEDMLSLFTTVFEPYDKESYIANQEQVSIERIGGLSEGVFDCAKAVKITLKNGRVDYVVFATNREVQYRVDDLFDFKGSFGVYTLEDGVPSYSYINDGTLIGQTIAKDAYTGEIVDFTKTLEFENALTVSLDQTVSDLSELIGRSIYVANQGGGNATYVIKGASRAANGTVRLDLGDVTLIRALSSSGSTTTYTYDVAEGLSFRIPLSKTSDHVPSFDPIRKQSLAINQTKTIVLSAHDPDGQTLTYAAQSLPSGASFDSETKTFTWTPRENQIGVHTAVFTASNGLETAQLSVELEVFYTTNVNSVNIINGAQIRLTGKQGLRFISKVSQDFMKEVRDAGATDIEYGTILVPAEGITSLDEFVIGATVGGYPVAKVPAVYNYSITEEWIQYTAVLIDVKPKNYRRVYAARPYVKYMDADGEEHIVYGDTRVERSIYQVASAALNDSGRYSESELEALRSIVANRAVELTLASPAPDTVAGNAVCTSGHTFSVETSWTRTGGYEFSGEFLEGTDYTATVVLTMTDGTVFDTEYTISVNGNSIDSYTISEDGSTCTFDVFFEYRDSGFTGIY